MATRTPTRPEDEEIHGESQPKSSFGPGYDEQAALHKPASDPDEGAKERQDSIRNAEENPSQPAATEASGHEQASGGRTKGVGHIGGGYRTGDKFSTGSSRIRGLRHKIMRNKKKAAAGGIIGAVTGVSFFGFGILSGPAQLIQLSQILRKPLFSMEQDKQVRGSAMIRFWKTGDIGETRLSFIGTRVAGNALQKLGRNGITFHDRSATGRPGYAEIRTDRNASTQGRDMTSQEQRRAIARSLKVPFDDVKLGQRLTPEHRVFRVELPANSRGLDNHLNIQRNGLRQVNSGKWLFGKYVTSNEDRTLKRKFGLPRLFSPIQKLTGNVKEKFVLWASDKEERVKERRQARKAARTPNYNPSQKGKIDRAREAFRNRPNVVGMIGRGLYLAAGTCIARNVASSVAIANRAAVVAPSVIEATHFTSLGDKVKAGDGRIEQYGLEADSLQDEDGNTIWDGQALNALSDPRAGGKDLSPEYKQSFTNKDVESSIKDKFDIRIPPGISLAGIVCSKPGIATQFLISAVFTGLSCSTVVGCTAAAGKFIGSSIASAIALAFLSDKLVDALVKGDIDFESLPADQKGNLLAYASREAANMNARASGGTMLSDSDQQAMEQEQRLADQNEFQSKSWASRMFDVNDHRSLVSRAVIQKASPSPKQNISNVASALTNFGSSIASSFSGLLSALIPNAFAAEPYSWNFPKYGIPRNVFNNPNYADPYKNAKKVAKLFGNNEDHKYIKRAEKCFGVDIKKDGSGVWAAVANDDIINPAETEYHKENCNDSNSDWRRVQLFVFDSRLADSMACLDEDEEFGSESCANLAADDSVEGGGFVPDIVAGEGIDIANIDKPSAGIACASGTRNVGVYDGYTEGRKVKIRLCALPNLSSTGEESNGGYGVSGGNGRALVNSRVSGAWFSLIQAMKEDGISTSAYSTFRSMAHQQELCSGNSGCSAGDYTSVAKPGTSNHQLGVAIDFADIWDSVGGHAGSCTPKQTSPADTYKWLNRNANRFGIKQYCAEAWHWSPKES